MQSLSKRTRTDAALSLLSVFPIELEIDARKLTLFRQMCRLNSNSWVKMYSLTDWRHLLHILMVDKLVL